MLVFLGALRLSRGRAITGLVGLCSLACGATSHRGGADGGAGGVGQTGGSANVSAGTAAGGGGGIPPALSGGERNLRVLTRSEYKTALADLLGTVQVINQLLVAALSCNLTRVFTHMWSGPRSDDVYPTLQLSGGHHAYTHGADGVEPRSIEQS